MDCLTSNDEAGGSDQTPTADQWNEVKPEIIKLYITNNLSLPKTMAEMEKLGFFATKRTYKAKLTDWRLGKNATREDWLWFARLYQEHAATGTSEICIRIHHKIRRIQDLRRYLKSHQEKEDAFLTEAMLFKVPAPKHIHVCNPDGSNAIVVAITEKETQPQGDETQNDISTSSTHQKSPKGQRAKIVAHEVCPFTNPWFQAAESSSAALKTQLPATYFPRNPQPIDSQFTATTGFEPQDFDATDTDLAFDQFDDTYISAWFDGLSNLNSFQCVSGGNASDMRQNIGGEAPQTPNAYGKSPNIARTATPARLQAHKAASDNHNAEDAYTAACMFACMFGAARRWNLMTESLERASSFFRQMCRFQSPSVLTATSFMLTWLLVHAEGSVPEVVMTASLNAATEALGTDNPVSVLLTWMAASAAGNKLEECGVGSVELQDVWQGFCQSLGEEHGHTIVALYCLSFHLMLADKDFAKAEQYLQHLSAVSAKVFGLGCILTINILSTLSRAQQRQCKYLPALETINKSLSAAPLGLNHPHRLELLLRKALILRKLDRWDETEELYWVVVKGRVATLGWHHKTTIAAHESLVWVLQRNGTWETRKGDVHKLLVDPEVSVSDYENWWRRFVEENRATMIED